MLPVTVVIPTRDRPRLLRETVQSILDGDELPAQLIVADQSAGEAEPLPAGGGVEIVHLRLSSVGLSRGRNAGIAAARHDVLVFTDDDVQVEPAWLGRLVQAIMNAPERTAVTGSVLAPPTIEVEGHVPSMTYRTEPEVYSGRLFADVLFPGNMAIRRRAFQEVGLFDERLGAGSAFPASEDNDLCFRLLEAGYQVRFVPDAVLYHLGIRRGRALARLNWAYGRGQGAFYAKHMSWSDRHMLRRFGRNAAFRIRRMTRALRGERQALGEGVYLLGLVSGALGWWCRYRRGSGAAG